MVILSARPVSTVPTLPFWMEFQKLFSIVKATAGIAKRFYKAGHAGMRGSPFFASPRPLTGLQMDGLERRTVRLARFGTRFRSPRKGLHGLLLGLPAKRTRRCPRGNQTGCLRRKTRQALLQKKHDERTTRDTPTGHHTVRHPGTREGLRLKTVEVDLLEATSGNRLGRRTACR